MLENVKVAHLMFPVYVKYGVEFHKKVIDGSTYSDRAFHFHEKITVLDDDYLRQEIIGKHIYQNLWYIMKVQ